METKVYHCNNCRKDVETSQVKLFPLDFRKNDEGKLESDFTRYSVFCGTCSTLITLVDPAADLMRQKIQEKV